MLRILAVIPCRSGSIGVPHKNIRPLNNRPLMDYAIKPALESIRIEKVVVNTDNQKYANIASDLGATPYLRPLELAEDVPTEDVVIDMLNTLEQKYDILVTLQCTTPGILPLEIDYMIEKVVGGEFDSATTICKSDVIPSWLYYKSVDGQITNVLGKEIKGEEGIRQEHPQSYVLTGACYVSKVADILKYNKILGGRIYGFDMPQNR
ncbi:MAG: acylneuraminate cytidylyltransferase family protein, partial [Candidatus Daviesbacteria bacterium]|nr:acylneuraminate cytidylyltransferase family protein [Candidatus Daviesbacteria bacterium]